MSARSSTTRPTSFTDLLTGGLVISNVVACLGVVDVYRLSSVSHTLHAMVPSLLGSKDIGACVLQHSERVEEAHVWMAALQGLDKIVALHLTVYGDSLGDIGTVCLRLAAAVGHVQVTRLLIECGVDIHSRGNYALKKAARYGHLDIVRILISAGADERLGDGYALHWAALKGHLDIVRLLVTSGVESRAAFGEALQWANLKGHSDVVEFLLSVGAYNNTYSAVTLTFDMPGRRGLDMRMTAA